MLRCGETAPRMPLRSTGRAPGQRWRAAARQPDAAGDDFGIDEVAAAALRQQVAFVDEQLVGKRNRVAGDAELRGKHARGRQRDTDGNVAVQDGGDEHLADLRLRPDLAAKRKLDQLVPHAGINAMRNAGHYDRAGRALAQPASAVWHLERTGHRHYKGI